MKQKERQFGEGRDQEERHVGHWGGNSGRGVN